MKAKMKAKKGIEKPMVIGIITLLLIAILVVVLMGKQFVGKAIAVQGSEFDVVYDQNQLKVVFNPKAGTSFTGVYFELQADSGQDICQMLGDLGQSVSDPIFGGGFYQVQCNNGIFKFSDNKLTPFTPSGEVMLVKLTPNLQDVSILELTMPTLDIYNQDGIDLFMGNNYKFSITLPGGSIPPPVPPNPDLEICNLEDDNDNGQIDEGCCVSETLAFCTSAFDCRQHKGTWDGASCQNCVNNEQCAGTALCVNGLCEGSAICGVDDTSTACCNQYNLDLCLAAEECQVAKGIWGSSCGYCSTDDQCGAGKACLSRHCEPQEVAIQVICRIDSLTGCSQGQCAQLSGVWDGSSCGNCDERVSCGAGKECQNGFCTAAATMAVSNTGQAVSGGYHCSSEYTCQEWGMCSNGKQLRSCYDFKCSQQARTEERVCGCSEYWNCDSWSECRAGIQTRTCQDSHNCGTSAGQPVLTQSCQSVKIQSEGKGSVSKPASKTPAQAKPIEQEIQQPEVQQPKAQGFANWIIYMVIVLVTIVGAAAAYIHFKPKKAYNMDELKAWVQQMKSAGVSDSEIRTILADKTGWGDEDIDRVLAS